jgi:anaerobic magnesium-protoporphyrin IX monomethyl ester cyclase
MNIQILWPVIDLHKGENQFVGISQISALLNQKDFASEVIGAHFKKIGSRLRKDTLTMLGFSTPTVYAQTYIELSRKLKREGPVFSIFGGPHPTYFPDMLEKDGVDAICRGEGEYPMVELVEAFGEGRPINEIPNLWIKEDGRVFRNPLRPLIEDLDSLPIPDHEIFLRAVPNNIWQAVVMTSRGCPYHCTYCYNHVYRELYRGKGRMIRRRSVGHVIEELKFIKAHKNYEFIRFVDDLFTLSPEWIEEFSEEYRKEIGLPFSCLVRANHITAKMARELKTAGCRRVQMGLESGDEDVRNKIFKRNLSEGDIVRAARLIQAEGMKLQTGNILGSPGTSLAQDLRTLDLNMRIKPDYAGVTLLQPYPGTEIFEYARNLGMLDSAAGALRETTVGRKSTLKFKRKREKTQIENLQKLFFLPIEIPWSFRLVKALIKLPPNRIYDFLFSRWVNYCQFFRIAPPRIGRKNLWKRSKLLSGAYTFLRLGSAYPRRQAPSKESGMTPS